jgi:hypothetical protein
MDNLRTVARQVSLCVTNSKGSSREIMIVVGWRERGEGTGSIPWGKPKNCKASLEATMS